MSFLRKLSRSGKKPAATPKMKISFMTCTTLRPQTLIFVKGLNRLYQTFGKSVDMRLYAACADKFEAQPLEQCSMPVEVVFKDNTMVGRKWNEVLNLALAGEPADYYIKIDDDDLVSNEGFAAMLSMMKQGYPYLGFKDCIFYDGYTGDASYFSYPMPGKVMGAIRAWSSGAIERAAMRLLVDVHQGVNNEWYDLKPGERQFVPYHFATWLQPQGIASLTTNEEGGAVMRARLWTNEWNRSLDYDSDLRFAAAGIMATHVPTSSPAVVDIKTDRNIWPYSVRAAESQPYDASELKKWISADEYFLLNNLKNQKPNE